MMKLFRHLLLLVLLFPWQGALAGYLVGVGKADITGPVADVNLMGYAMPMQIARGIHTRLYARAFVFADMEHSRNRFLFVNIDSCMASQLVTIRVVRQLQELYGGLYSEENVAIIGTHTHASPAGFLQYVLFSVSSFGFVAQSFHALVDGIMEAVVAAHNDLSPARLSLAWGPLSGASINRSPTAYLANPAAERQQHDADVEQRMDVLRIHTPGPDGRGRALISWFAVHCTSMNNTNPLVSGDNKGAAELVTEQWAAAYPHLGQPGVPFVAAFAQSSVGDTSPNVLGAFCIDTGAPCDRATSTCGGRNELCHGRGPAWPDDTASTAIIGQRQADKARQLWQAATAPLPPPPLPPLPEVAAAPAQALDQARIRPQSAPGQALGQARIRPQSSSDSALEVEGPLDYRHRFINMSQMVVKGGSFTRVGVTCPAALGFSFAAGTTDGPGAFDFTQGDTNGTDFWRAVRNFISEPSPEQVACHAPKPILLNTGFLTRPYLWTPEVTEVSLMRLGPLVIIAVPGEFTTMAGRRIRRAVYETVKEHWGLNTQVVLSGLTNTYSSYITTWEEYQVQRYEGGSTLYGPHTLDAYIQIAVEMAQDMVAGRPSTRSVQPPDLYDEQLGFLPPVVLDAVPWGSGFGDVVVQPEAEYRAGETMEVVFRSGCPRNHLRRGGTFLLVQRQEEEAAAAGSSSRWVNVTDDSSWQTRFYWERHWKLSTHSFATVSWSIPTDAPPGTYRIVHLGDRKNIWGKVLPFTGTSRAFSIMLPASTTHSDAAGSSASNGQMSKHMPSSMQQERDGGRAEPLLLRRPSAVPATAAASSASKWWRGKGPCARASLVNARRYLWHAHPECVWGPGTWCGALKMRVVAAAAVALCCTVLMLGVKKWIWRAQSKNRGTQ